MGLFKLKKNVFSRQPDVTHCSFASTLHFFFRLFIPKSFYFRVKFFTALLIFSHFVLFLRGNWKNIKVVVNSTDIFDISFMNNLQSSKTTKRFKMALDSSTFRNKNTMYNCHNYTWRWPSNKCCPFRCFAWKWNILEKFFKMRHKYYKTCQEIVCQMQNHKNRSLILISFVSKKTLF